MKEKFGKIISIGISKETHSLVKEYCNKHALKIGLWLDSIILDEIYRLDDIEKGRNKRKTK